MPHENNNPGEKPLKHPFIIYADLECLLEKIDACHNNLIQKRKLSINPQDTR